jgi:acyl carrier protein
VFIESEFGVFIPDTDLTVEHMDSVDQIVRRIESASEPIDPEL